MSSSNWDPILADSHFAGASWALPIGPDAPLPKDTPQTIELSPLNFVTDVEPAGFAFHQLAFPTLNTYTVPVLEQDEVDVEELVDSVKEAELNDYYGLLFVKDPLLPTTQLEELVKKHWKIINLYLHPDKADGSRKAEAEIRFKACLKAFETLTDQALRVDFDSSIEFDDSIPTASQGTKGTADFLKVYAPVFERNARWSKSQPVPLLGEEDATEEELNKFYKFWLGFASWRDFPSADTEKIGDSAGRQQRRDAVAKNAKQRATKKTQEATRLRNLTTQAQKIDPRYNLFKQQRAEQEKAAKQAAYDAKKGSVAAKDQGKTPASAAATTTTASQPKQQQPKLILPPNTKPPAQTVEEKQQEYMDMVKNKLHGALTNDKHFIVNIEKRIQIPEIVNKVVSSYDYTQFKKFDDMLLVNGYVDLHGVNGRRILEIEPVRFAWDQLEGRTTVQADEGSNAWSEAEERALTDALIKIPIGTKERYAKVTIQVNLINGLSKKHRTEKQIIKKVKEMELIKQVGGIEKYRQLMAEKSGGVVPTAAAAPSATTNTTITQPVTAAVVWSADDQKLLEKGLGTVSKDDPQRWDKIAELVKTKDGKQCEARFNWLREQIAAKKAAAAAAAKK